MEMKKALGAILRDIRTEKLLTLHDVADKVPMSIAHMSEAERGHNEVSSQILDSWCRVLRVPTYQIVIEAGYRMGGLPSEMPTHEMVAPIRELV
jgi:transcriptional regulator with XRE-family HTH domain